MAYVEDEVSVHGSAPVELYLFEGTFGEYCYTSSELPVTFEGRDYLPVPMQRSEVVAGTQDDDKLDVTVELPVTAELIRVYAFQISPPELEVTIYRKHRGSAFDDFALYWVGKVGGVSVSEGIGTLRSPSILSEALSGNAPSVYYQTPCNHVLFDNRCQVSRVANSVTTEVTSVNDIFVAVASIGGKPDLFFVGGEMVTEHGERRMVIGQAGLTLTVNYPFANVVEGTSVEVVAGCDHDYEGDCASKFDNQKQYGGFKFIPTYNPFESGID